MHACSLGKKVHGKGENANTYASSLSEHFRSGGVFQMESHLAQTPLGQILALFSHHAPPTVQMDCYREHVVHVYSVCMQLWGTPCVQLARFTSNVRLKIYTARNRPQRPGVLPSIDFKVCLDMTYIRD